MCVLAVYGMPSITFGKHPGTRIGTDTFESAVGGGVSKCANAGQAAEAMRGSVRIGLVTDSGLGLTYTKRVLLGPDRGAASRVSGKMQIVKAQECLGSGL